jgi:hypothetical protein
MRGQIAKQNGQMVKKATSDEKQRKATQSISAYIIKKINKI